MPIKNFSQYLIEEEREVYFTFGRMNPPTIGHGKVMDVLAKKSGKSDYKVYVSQSQNAKKDPLSYTDKVKHVRKMFPKHARQVMMDKDVKSVFDIAVKLYDQGYTKINMVVGADRVREFDVLLNKYNGTKARHGFYNFKKINIVSAGERDPDATGVEGMSASKQRENATKNDFVTFAQGVPKGMSDKDTRKLFNDVRKGMGLKEELQFKNHIELETVSETREQYVSGQLFQVGDTVVIKESDEIGTVSMLGANYVIVECGDKKMRKWLDSVELVEKQDPDIKDREGTQPARYHAGLKKSTKAKRDAHFKKHGKKADDDESAYKPAPGDKTAKTKPSKYTKAFKDMYDEDCWDGYKEVGMKKKGSKMVPNCVAEYGGPKISRSDYLKKGRDYHSVKEEVSQKELNDLEKFADRLLNKFDVDIEFTRHFADRMNDKRNKPAIDVEELKSLFKKMADNKGKKIKKHGNSEAILKDMQSDLNLPVVINWKNGEFEVVNKTIMRKKAFKSPDPQLKYESVDLEESWFTDWIAGLGAKSIQKSDYEKAAKWVANEIKKSKGRHGADYFAQELIRKSGAKLNRKHIVSLIGEAIDPVDRAKDKVAAEKEADKKKHDRILDRARLAAVRKKNRETK